VNWDNSPLVERVPGKMGGKPVVKGTRIEPETVLQDFELGSSVEEIHENFPSLPVDIIRALLAFAQRQQPVP
jgi:uncharacterized protein (DUF433 family)